MINCDFSVPLLNKSSFILRDRILLPVPYNRHFERPVPGVHPGNRYIPPHLFPCSLCIRTIGGLPGVFPQAGVSRLCALVLLIPFVIPLIWILIINYAILRACRIFIIVLMFLVMMLSRNLIILCTV